MNKIFAPRLDCVSVSHLDWSLPKSDFHPAKGRNLK